MAAAATLAGLVEFLNDAVLERPLTVDEAVEILHVQLSVVGLHLSSEGISREDAHALFDLYLEDPFRCDTPHARFVVGMVVPS